MNLTFQEYHKLMGTLVINVAETMRIDHPSAVLAIIEYLITLSHTNAPEETVEYLEVLLNHYRKHKGFPSSDTFFEMNQQLRDILTLASTPTYH